MPESGKRLTGFLTVTDLPVRLSYRKAQSGLVCPTDPDSPKADNFSRNSPFLTTHRRRILTQLNRGESRHGVARAVFHGQRGEVRQRYAKARKINSGRWAWS